MLVHHRVEVRVVGHVVDVAVACRCPSSASGWRGSGGSRARVCVASDRSRSSRSGQLAPRSNMRVSRSSIQCRTGVSVPDSEMRHAADVGADDDVGPRRLERAQLVRLAAARRCTGCSTEYVPAEPQHRCASATGSSEWPMASRISSTWPRMLHAVLQRARRMERDALRPLVHRDHRRDLLPFRRSRSRSDRARARRSSSPSRRTRRRARGNGRSPSPSRRIRWR